ncbi:hypothetical protein KC19_6G176800 [Ceratodon purpureus]|uniref:EF-hand domain-containing protein n=1 Tax=Ceratodon purpureus TaxID=3225 RepID=A0A8T0HFU9_CERPU|nr:hypothetical protein KC19_6G176800 [Ceratodon purpureus]
MILPRHLPVLLRRAVASSYETSLLHFWNRSSSLPAESSSRWIAASSVCGSGSSGEANRPALLAAWSAAFMAGVVAMDSGRSDGVACCEAGLERPLLSPMGKTPESKLAQPKFFLSEAYRRRIFFNYERRLRMRSPPEKVFFYFSSVRREDENFMTAGDLMRAIVPVFPPSGSHLVREGYLGGERSPGELKCPPSKFFMLFDTNGDGMISFPEYIFFITLLSIPEKNFRATFRMFDVNENGLIDREEFKKVMAWMRDQNRFGRSHSGGRRTGLHVSGDVENAGLVELFFGRDGQRQLSMDQFEKFMKDLHSEIIHLEFAHYDFDGQGTISATDFGLSMTASADLSKINHYLDRVQDLATIPHFAHMRITIEEFIQFATLRKKIPVMALAISSFGKIQGKLSKDDVKRAAAKICHAPISDAVVDIIFHIFDTDADGVLSMDEFLGVLQRREREVADPTDTGFVQYFKCMVGCASNCQKPWGL